MSQWIISAHDHNLTNLVYYGTMAAGIAGELITALVLSKKYRKGLESICSLADYHTCAVSVDESTVLDRERF